MSPACGASRQFAVSIPVVLLVAAAGDAVRAQAPHPFAPARAIPTFSLNAVAGVLDVNRDGAQDVVVPGPFFGTLATTLDELGAPLATNGAGPGLTFVPGAPTSPVVLAATAGTFDVDALEDLVTVATTGTVHFHHNVGSLRIDRSHFAPDVIVDNFLTAFPINPPFVNYSFPVAHTVDLDRDGHLDVLLAGGPIDRWGASTRPGFVALYRGDGAGGFQVVRHGLAGNVVDAEVADLDHDGVDDHVVVLTETGSLGAYAYEIVHLALVNGALATVGFPQNLGPGRFTALELADVAGDANLDYLLAQTTPGSPMGAEVYHFEGDGQGNVNLASWGTFLLPPNATALGAFVASIQVGDWNRDSHPDLAVLRGFTQAPPAYSGAQATHADSEVLVLLGPNLPFASCTSLPLPGYHRFSSVDDPLFAMLPLQATPDFLRPIDLGRDGSIDLLVTGLRPLAALTTTCIATLRNLIPPATGDTGFVAVGTPSGGNPAFPARIGFDGGPPRAGNSAFACTVQNVQGGCLVGLLWSPLGQADLFSAYGFTLHLAPSFFGCGVLACGTQAGEGFSSFPLPIPPLPALVGDAGFFQYDYYDHAAGVFGGTQATNVWIGP